MTFQKIAFALLLSLILFLNASAEDVEVGGDSVKLRPWDSGHRLHVLCEQNNYVLASYSLDVGNCLVLFEKPTKPGEGIIVRKKAIISIGVNTGTISGNLIYISDSKRVHCFDFSTLNPSSDKRLESFLGDDKCYSVVDEEKAILLTEKGFSVFDLHSGKTYFYPVNLEFPETTRSSFPELFKTGSGSYFLFDRESQTLVTFYSLDGSIRKYKGLQWVTPCGGAFLTLGIDWNLDDAPLIDPDLADCLLQIVNGKLVKSEIKVDRRRMTSTYTNTFCLSMRIDDEVHFYSSKELVFTYKLPSKRLYDSRNYNFSGNSEKRYSISETSVYVCDNRTSEIYWYPLPHVENDDVLPFAGLISASLESHDNKIEMLFADGNWVSVSIPDWKVSKKVKCTDREIYSSSPHNGHIAFFDGCGIYSIDEEGKRRKWSIKARNMYRIQFEQGGTKAILLRCETPRFHSGGRCMEITAVLLETKDWYKSDLRINRLAKSRKQRYYGDDLNCWRSINFLGNSGAMIAKGPESTLVFPDEANVEIDFGSENMLNTYWAGGFVVYPDKIINLHSSIEVRTPLLDVPNYNKDYQPTCYVPAFEIPNLRYVFFCIPSSTEKPDKMVAVCKELENNTYDIEKIDTPDGTRWLVKHGSDLLCISAFGRLLGRFPIPKKYFEVKK